MIRMGYRSWGLDIKSKCQSKSKWRNMKSKKIYDFEDRLVRFAAEMVIFFRKCGDSFEIKYYKQQMIRSSGSAALNYGEAQGTVTTKDFINKMSISVKELKETRTALKILAYLDFGNSEKLNWLLNEVGELIAIASKMILNKK